MESVSENENNIQDTLIMSGNEFLPEAGHNMEVPMATDNTLAGTELLIISAPENEKIPAVKDFFNTHPQSFLPLYCDSAASISFILQHDHNIRLIFLDLEMPDMQGLHILSRIYNKFSAIRVCAIGTPPVTGENITIIDREHSPQATAQQLIAIFELTAAKQHSPFIEFLSLLEQTKQTVLLEIITDDSGPCLCVFEQGSLVDAMYKNKKGEEAILAILALDNPFVNIKKISHKKIKKRINRTIAEIISAPPQIDTNSAKNTLPTNSSIKKEKEAGDDIPPHLPAKQLNNIREENLMALEEHLTGMTQIKGFKAAAIMNFTGEILVDESVDSKIDLNLVGATFNDIFRTAHGACQKIGMHACSETTIKTPDGIIIMGCSGVEAEVHFHVISIIDADGNQALAKMEIDKLIPKAMAELA